MGTVRGGACGLNYIVPTFVKLRAFGGAHPFLWASIGAKSPIMVNPVHYPNNGRALTFVSANREGQRWLERTDQVPL